MLNSTADADDVGDYLRIKYPEEFGTNADGEKQLLVIHTDRSGEVSKKDLDAARETARQVDEGTSPINAIVSVLMLREGWDVQNVTVIVGLRPYTAKANILPEQTIGRGLRLMFGGLGAPYIERVDVIGNPAFLKFVEQLERDEDIALDTFDLKEPLVITTIAVDPGQARLRHHHPGAQSDLGSKEDARRRDRRPRRAQRSIVRCSRARKAMTPRSSSTTKASTSSRCRSSSSGTTRSPSRRPPKRSSRTTPSASLRTSSCRHSSQLWSPRSASSFETKAFGERVDLDDRAIIKAIATSVAQYVTVKTFAKALRGLGVEELTPTLESPGRKLSETEPFPFSRPTFAAKKTVFNLVAADNEFERDFAKFLEDALDVHRFRQAPWPLRFLDRVHRQRCQPALLRA